MLHALFPDDHHLGLMTDLYELTMAAGYHVHGMAEQQATFEFSVRKLPKVRNYLVAAGVEQVVQFLQNFSFAPEQITYLREHPAFSHIPQATFDWLATLRFDGDVWAMPEGTVFFPPAPVLRITAPLAVGQIIETFVITSMMFQTMVASRASRIVQAAGGRGVFDFGSRRAHGPQAGLLAARATYIGGCTGTSNVEAGRRMSIPTVGTQAHAWIMAFGDEIESFRKFGELFPNACTLLVDTYDTIAGVKNAIRSGVKMQAVRLDSGDLTELSKQARKLLDEAGMQHVKIVGSGDLNEYKIVDLLGVGACVDAFGVGTEMVTSRDEPTLYAIYKLVEQETRAGVVGRVKMAKDKISYPYAKQTIRYYAPNGQLDHDLIARATEKLDGEPLMVPVMRNGQLVGKLPSLEDARQRCAAQRDKLPVRLHQLSIVEPYPVKFSEHLESEARRLAAGKH
jgi:nicotinate phosphoribosyltransferase